MNQKEFESLVRKTYASLPREFREVCDGVALQVEDFPEKEILDYFKMDNPYHLLGLYSGVNLLNRSVVDPPFIPDSVFIYREPILAYAEQHQLLIKDVVRHVVVHEYGHHMGFSDEDMEAIEAAEDDSQS